MYRELIIYARRL